MFPKTGAAIIFMKRTFKPPAKFWVFLRKLAVDFQKYEAEDEKIFIKFLILEKRDAIIDFVGSLLVLQRFQHMRRNPFPDGMDTIF